MLSIEPPIGGFTTWSAEGHGRGFEKASVGERVRGRVDRMVLVAVLPRTQVPRLLEEIRTHAPVPHLTYWVEHIDGFGQLALPSEPMSAPASSEKYPP